MCSSDRWKIERYHTLELHWVGPFLDAVNIRPGISTVGKSGYDSR